MVLCGVRAMDPPLSAGAAFPSPNAQAQTDAHAPFGKNEEVKARSTRSVRPKIHKDRSSAIRIQQGQYLWQYLWYSNFQLPY